MLVPHLHITSDSSAAGGAGTPTSPFQAVQGTGSKYTLPDGVDQETIIAIISDPQDEPAIDDVSFFGENVLSVTMRIYRKDSLTEYVEYTDQNLVRSYLRIPDKLTKICLVDSSIFKLDESISILRGVLCSFSFNFIFDRKFYMQTV